MTEEQAEIYLNSLDPYVYYKFAKVWEETMWRLPTSLASFANWIQNNYAPPK